MLFAERDGTKSEAQIKAFGDAWRWDAGGAADLSGGSRAWRGCIRCDASVSDVLRASSDMLAYLAMMAPRLVELRRVLKLAGSIYLRCDPTASHCLKILMDAVFGPEKFRSEIIWKRSSAHSDTKQGRKQHGRIHDVLLFYTKGEHWTWNPIYTRYDEEYKRQFYKYVEEGTGRSYRLGDLTGPGGAAKGNPAYEVMGVTRYWRYSRQRMAKLIAEGRVVQTRPGAVPAYKRYLDEMPGVPLQDVWSDINPIASQAQRASRLSNPEAGDPVGAHRHGQQQ